MRLALSANFIRPGKVGGVEQAFYNLALGLTDCGAEVSIVCAESGNLPEAQEQLLQSRGARLLRRPGKVKNRFWADETFAASPGATFDATIFPNYYLPHFLSHKLGKTIAVVHDLQHRHYPHYSSRQRRLWLEMNLPRILDRSDAVVCISDETCRDVEREYRCNPAKLHSIPNPVDWSRFDVAPNDVALVPERPYILAVAHHFPHKNLETLVSAAGALQQLGEDFRLVLVGQNSTSLGLGGYTNSLMDKIREMGLDTRVTLTGHVNDAQLGRLYRSASLFCFPSIFEGFGLPPVEAMGLGVPTLVSDIPALREVTMGLSFYVSEPRSVDAWRERIRALLHTPRDQRTQECVAFRIREAYSPAAVARRYVALVETLKQ